MRWPCLHKDFVANNFLSSYRSCVKKFLTAIFFAAARFSVGVANPPLDLFPIDATTRGVEFASILNTAFSLATASGEVVIQTQATPPFLRAPGVQNGIIPYVQNTSMFPFDAPNSTLFIFAYNPNGSIGVNQTTQFLVVGIEQIVTVVYRNTVSPPFPLTPAFQSNYAANILPLVTINPSLRAVDIQNIAQQFLSSPTTFNGNNGSQLWITTTLSGPFYVPFASNVAPGAIPNVTAISVLSSEFLLITYKPLSSLFSWSVIVSAEQVQQIVFYPTNYPSS
jgi:hypothetical protein